MSSAKKQKISRAMNWFSVVAPRLGRPVRVVLQQLDVELVEPPRRPDVDWVVLDLLDGGDARQRKEEAEVLRQIGIGAGERLAEIRSSASSVAPSVASMNLALAEPVFGLARSAASVAPTLPAGAIARWMLLRCSTPPGTSDRLDEPLRSRLIVVSFIPNAARNRNGNSAGSKGCSQFGYGLFDLNGVHVLSVFRGWPR